MAAMFERSELVQLSSRSGLEADDYGRPLPAKSSQLQREKAVTQRRS